MERSNESTEKPPDFSFSKGWWKKLLKKIGFGRVTGRSFESEEDFHRLIEEGEEEGIIEEEEHELIQSVIEFGDTVVRQVMVPRVKITAVPLDTTLEAVLDIIIENGHSRIPVYDQKIDNIVGVAYAKDLLKLFKAEKRDIKINTLIRPPYFVPETMKVMDLLKEFQRQKIHIAIVVDEYGGTAGIVTIEDLLEELVGEIQDEYDNEREKLVKLDENTISVDAQINIEDIEEFFDLEIPSDDFEFETVGGLLFHLLEKIPREGEVVVFQGLRFTIAKADERRIRRVKISRELTEDTRDEKDNEK